MIKRPDVHGGICAAQFVQSTSIHRKTETQRSESSLVVEEFKLQQGNLKVTSYIFVQVKLQLQY